MIADHPSHALVAVCERASLVLISIGYDKTLKIIVLDLFSTLIIQGSNRCLVKYGEFPGGEY